MTIINQTTFKSETIKGVIRASNFDNNRYKTFKLIYNLFGLLFGMMVVRYLVLEMIGSTKADKVMLWFYIFVTTILLYLGMIGMDRNTKHKFEAAYKQMIGVTFTYEISSDDIVMTDQDQDSEEFSWDKVIKWNEDQDYFYLFVDAVDCLILDKKGFQNGQQKDFKQLITAIMAVRSEQNENQEQAEIKKDEPEQAETKKDEPEQVETK